MPRGKPFLQAGMVSRPVDSAVAFYLKRLLALEAIGRGFEVFRDYIRERGEDCISWKQPTSETVLVRIRRFRPKSPVVVETSSIDLDAYRKAMRNRYGRLKLEELDPTTHDIRPLTLIGMFIAQNARECLGVRAARLRASQGIARASAAGWRRQKVAADWTKKRSRSIAAPTWTSRRAQCWRWSRNQL